MIQLDLKTIPYPLLKDLITGAGIPDQPNLLQQLKQQFDYDFFLPPTSVRVQTYVAIIDFLRQKLFPQKPVAEGYFLLGIASLEGHFQSPVGKINKVAARMFSMEKAVQLYLKTQRYNYPFGEHEMEEIKTGYLRYHRQGVPTPPDFTCGVLSYLVQLTGGKEVKVTYRTVKQDDVIYEVQWQ